MTKLSLLLRSPARRYLLKIRFERILRDFIDGKWNRAMHVIAWILSIVIAIMIAYFIALTIYTG